MQNKEIKTQDTCGTRIVNRLIKEGFREDNSKIGQSCVMLLRRLPQSAKPKKDKQ